MEKTGNGLTNLLEKRWSRRSFSEEKLDKQDILAIFEAGKEIASCFNEQPWYFIFAHKDDAHYKELFDSLTEMNQSWVKTGAYLGVAFGKKSFTKTGKVNPHYFHDVGAFMAVASLKATELGLFMHQMAGFSAGSIKNSFKTPDDYEPITMFVIGKPGDANQLPKELQEKENPESERKGIDGFLFGGTWGEPLYK